MKIKRIKVNNFKSFKELDLNLDKFNVLIGANASGKSNFIQIFKFLRDIIDFGLSNAISLQGGIEYLRNMSLNTCDEFSLAITLAAEPHFGFGTQTKKGVIGIRLEEVTYEFVLKFTNKKDGFEIHEDKITQKCEFVLLEEKGKKIRVKKEMGRGTIRYWNDNGKIKLRIYKPKDVSIEREAFLPIFLKDESLPSKTLLLQRPIMPFFFELHGYMNDFSIYDFDPKLPKKATPITGKAELEEDGSNLSIVLKNITDESGERKKLFNLIKDLLPFIEDLDVEKFADKSLMFKLQEKFYQDKYLPASLISDGTINLTALLVALYFSEQSLVIIEEPERNIHPFLIAKITNMMQEASQKKQIIVTTHNPEIVKHCELENLLLVSRYDEGYSVITKPIDNKEVRIFLENEIGIDELFIQNLLGV